jgi:hypothetical protein
MTFSGMMDLPNLIRRQAMERFLTRHRSRIIGVLSGFDRVVFRGTLPSIIHTRGMGMYLSSQRVLLKDFQPFAKKISQQIIKHAQVLAEKSGRRFEYISSSRTSKEEVAGRIMKQDNIQQGLICVLSCVEPCKSYTIVRDPKDRQLKLKKLERKCLHLYFYYLDRDFGFMHLRLQTWFPFTIQVCINGREWLARQMERVGIGYEQHDNCFTGIENVPKAQQILDRLTKRHWVPFANALERKVMPWHHHGYYWTIWQGEYATDVMFKDAASLAEIYPALIDHAVKHFDSPNVLRFLGRRTNTRFNGEVKSDLSKRIEGVRIKHWVEENSIKMYDKQGSILRIETTINNPKRFKVRRWATRKGQRVLGWFPMRKGVADTVRRALVSRAANERYLEALSVVGNPFPSHRVLDPVSKRVVRDGRSYRPLHPIGPDEAELFKSIMRGEFALQGFRNKELRALLEPTAEKDPIKSGKASARITRKLRLLREHGLIRKVSKTQYYRVTEKGHQVMATSIAFRETDIALLKAA